VLGLREPPLYQRVGRRDRKEGQPYGHQKQPQKPQKGIAIRRRSPVGGGHGYGQHQKRQQHQNQMNHGLAAGAKPGGGGVHVEVARQQRSLEEHHRAGPHRGGAAEGRQHELGEHGLYKEK
jgi:hypothetical protein